MTYLSKFERKRAVFISPNATVVVSFALSVCVLCLTGPGNVARVFYPIVAVLVGSFLLKRSGPAYVSFVMWLWFLSGFVRRIVDLRSGFQDSSYILLAPYLVTALSGLYLVKRFKKIAEPQFRPVLLALIAIVYGAIIGKSKYTFGQMAPALLNWLVPVLLCFTIIDCGVAAYSTVRKAVLSSFFYGAIVMGAYAVYQFAVVPPWDRLWLEGVHINAFGLPLPMQVRAFSTMNAPVVLGGTLVPAILFALSDTRKVRYVAVIFGLAALSLSLVRTAWLGFVGGAAVIMLGLPVRAKIKLMSGLAIAVVALLSLGNVPSIQEVLAQRIKSFSSPSEDASYVARTEGYQRAIRTLLSEPYGEGVGSSDVDHATTDDNGNIGPHDSTFLALLYSFGWLGAIAYASAIVQVLIVSLRPNVTGQLELVAQRGVLLAFLLQMPLNDMVGGPVGLFFWIVCGLQMSRPQLPHTVPRIRSENSTFQEKELRMAGASILSSAGTTWDNRNTAS